MIEMDGFKRHLMQQLHDHRGIMPRDVVKLCYQAACGAEHLLSDLEGARSFFESEYYSAPERYEPLYEYISDEICRINLSAWKRTGMPSEWLFRMFTGTVFRQNGKERLTAYLDAAEDVLYRAGYDIQMWEEYLTSYKECGMPAVRHSEEYRLRENPAYRIVGTEFLKLLPILRKLCELPKNEECTVIAIDGKAGAGKSTIAALLQKVLGAGIIYMDDFFLPPSMRSSERLEEAGGNIHYERFVDQVLPYVEKRQSFSYERFDCSCMDFNGSQTVYDVAYRIVEGSYSHHPKFGNYMNLRVFVDIDPQEQMRRITKRNGEQLSERFQKEWIPMENQYCDLFQIREDADVVIESG